MIAAPVTLLVAPRTKPDRGVGVEALGEVRVIADADDVETRFVGEPGVSKHFSHLVDAVLQPDAEKHLSVGGHVGIVSMSFS